MNVRNDTEKRTGEHLFPPYFHMKNNLKMKNTQKRMLLKIKTTKKGPFTHENSQKKDLWHMKCYQKWRFQISNVTKIGALAYQKPSKKGGFTHEKRPKKELLHMKTHKIRTFYT